MSDETETTGTRAEAIQTKEGVQRKRLTIYFAVTFSAMLGILAGLGVFTFGYGKGASYLSNDPKGCANCHVMQDHFDSWQQSSHHHVAVCNDCHLPHDFVGKWVTKADNGFFHSLAFTLHDYHDPIQIKPRNRRVTQSSCIDCHEDFIHPLLPVETEAGTGDAKAHDMLSCVHCHSDVGHAFRTISSGSKRD
ncbi:Cytochrome c-type protein NrfH [Thalassoglobus polymorphus]|uniref:Cytochrome c-type protein NrfH n=1 Tax=Thalassoglobus polymorphus TaxID=2527994 RepID=A0A517QTE2_9PLAN|nr:cytochrome c nitrite reductase small subunit [Thalassoglobus polymorphus]QDT34904.1 Cytochrome c-type protein NrfH [Thalassoglobus polymorphus]